MIKVVLIYGTQKTYVNIIGFSKLNFLNLMAFYQGVISTITFSEIGSIATGNLVSKAIPLASLK